MATSSTASSTGSSSTTNTFPSASLYVGDLLPDSTEAILFEIFNAIGPVASVRVCRDAATRRSLGYAYVNFHRPDDAEKAMAALNFTEIRGRPCRIMWSHRDPSLRKSGIGNIFVKHLAKSIDNRTLYDTFNIFGSILSCKVARSPKGESLGYGFVHFESEEAAQQAISKVDGKMIAGQKVSVAAFKSKREREAKHSAFTNLYVKNLPLECTKEQLEELFSKHGPTTSVMVATTEDGKSRGFGFVNFETPEHAAAALEALNNYTMGDKQLYVGRAQKKEERERELRNKFEKLRLERQAKYQSGTNLYVKNVPETWDEKKLRDEFARFGSITSARIMRESPTGKSKGFGFVSFAAPEDATEAVTALNQQMIDGKPLYVALAQKKEQRRAEMEHRSRVHPAHMNPAAAAAMYYGQRPGAPFLFPAAAAGRGWVPMPGQGPMMRPGMYPYPMPGMLPQQPGRGNAQNGGGRGRRQGGAQQGQPRVVYEQTAQNVPGAGKANGAPAAAAAPAAATAPANKAPLQLTLSALAALPEQQKKQVIGEQLFIRIKPSEPKLAGKITGMLLEMDNGELISLLESEAALKEKVDEAKEVLKQHEAAAAAATETA